MAAISMRNSMTLGEIFKESMQGETTHIVQCLSGLQPGRFFTATVSEQDEKPIKGYAFERYNDEFYAYFAKNIFNPKSALPLQDCYTVDELAVVMGQPAIVSKRADGTPECAGKPQILGPLNLDEAVNLFNAVTYINSARQFEAIGHNFSRRFSGLAR